MIILCNTFLPNDKEHAIPAGIGKIIRLLLVIDKVIEVDIAPIITIVSSDSKSEFRFLKNFTSILIFGFCLWSK